jgi:hypothetical protein
MDRKGLDCLAPAAGGDLFYGRSLESEVLVKLSISVSLWTDECPRATRSPENAATRKRATIRY